MNEIGLLKLQLRPKINKILNTFENDFFRCWKRMILTVNRRCIEAKNESEIGHVDKKLPYVLLIGQ